MTLGSPEDSRVRTARLDHEQDKEAKVNAEKGQEVGRGEAERERGKETEQSVTRIEKGRGPTRI